MLLRTPVSLRVTGQGARGAEGAGRGAELRVLGSLRAPAVVLS